MSVDKSKGVGKDSASKDEKVGGSATPAASPPVQPHKGDGREVIAKDGKAGGNPTRTASPTAQTNKGDGREGVAKDEKAGGNPTRPASPSAQPHKGGGREGIAKEERAGNPARTASPPAQPPHKAETEAKDSRSTSPPLKARHSSRKGSSITWAKYEGVIRGRVDERLEDAYNAPRALSRDASRRHSRRSTPDVQSSQSRSISPDILPVSRWSSASPASGRSSRTDMFSPPTGSSPSLNSPSFPSSKGSPANGIYSTSPSSPSSPTGDLVTSSRSNLSPLSPLSRSPSPDGRGSRSPSPPTDQRPSLRHVPLPTNTPSCNCEVGDPKCEHDIRSPPRATTYVTLIPDTDSEPSLKQAAPKTEPGSHIVQTPRYTSTFVDQSHCQCDGENFSSKLSVEHLLAEYQGVTRRNHPRPSEGLTNQKYQVFWTKKRYF